MAIQMGADAHDATGFANQAAAFKSQGYGFVAQYIDQFPDANTGGSPSITKAQVQQEASAGLNIVSIFQTNGMSSSAGTGYQTYFTAAQGAEDAQHALMSAASLGQPAGSAVYFAMDFDPAVFGTAGSEANLLSAVRTYLGAVNTEFTKTGYSVGVYGAGDTLAAAIRTSPPVAQYGWLTQSYGWAGSNPASDDNAKGWDIYQGAQTDQNGVAIDPDTATSDTFGSWTVCYCSGTLIRTTRGDVAVEDLAVGDIAVTASGRPRPIRWLGHRTIDPRRHPRPEEVMPVRICAHAFGENRPARDLRVSPGHAIAVDVLGEVLIPAMALVNGATIVQDDVDSVTYWHVELDSHDILLAENLPAESYLEMGNRAFFAEGEVVALDALPDAPVPTHADFCRPFHDGGAVVEAVRNRLQARAIGLGWTCERPPLAAVRLEVDGAELEADIDGLAARFVVPASARDVWLVSPTSIPRQMLLSQDDRMLGVCLRGLSIDDGLGARREIGLDDPLLCAGFHELEDGVRRWTAGRARLPAPLWAGCRGTVFLRLDFVELPLARWVAPEPATGSRDRAEGQPRALTA